MSAAEETKKAKRATRKRNAILITLVVLGVLAYAALLYFKHVLEVLDSLH
jgi:hypothetical protein